MPPMEQHPADHDLLIRLDEKVETLIKSVEILTDDHEKRIRSLERYVWKAIGALFVIDLILSALIAIYAGK